MVRLHFVGLLSLTAASENELAGGKPNLQTFGHWNKGGFVGKIRESGTARAYNISDPVYTCPKAGWVLRGEDCIYEDSVAPRYECPVGFEPVGSHGSTPSDCIRTTAPVLTCPAGTLVGNVCTISEFTDPITTCPLDCLNDGIGNCYHLEAISMREVCPEGSQRVGPHCLFVEYHEPVYVCPPDTIQEGRRCRREYVYLKEKGNKGFNGGGFGHGRLLSEDETDELVAAEADEELEGAAFAVDDLFETDVEIAENELQGVKTIGGYPGGWVPAYDGVWGGRFEGRGGWDRGPYEYDGGVGLGKKNKAYTDTLKWQKIHVQVPVVAPVKSKTVKTKGPQQVVKISTQAAEKVCPIGERHGFNCITQHAVEPLLECPVPPINGQCARRVAVPPVTSCPIGTLVCPPRIPGTSCRCETSTEIPAVPVCNSGVLEKGTCVSHAQPREYCPLGYFLDRHANVCVKRDIEPALCLFSVTYVCPDCDFPSPPLVGPILEPHTIFAEPRPIPIVKDKAVKGNKFKYGGRGVYVLGDELLEDEE